MPVLFRVMFMLLQGSTHAGAGWFCVAVETLMLTHDNAHTSHAARAMPSHGGEESALVWNSSRKVTQG